ncbi:long-chain-fatty-acid--CoA ligase [Pseudomonas nitroreducens]|uniref:Long-chain-fatty-acid--CoA ligase n=2 Tax=Pseudomonas nitroreducens TaxID=46680 RepID=A0A6G6IPP7_PSENT|nr:long-chain fatty acid--CoA ligase [Pseudomonas nitroreducens]MBG6288621.1 long-chain fatty acid--CoA ligase [Pseudomonas nitroreducens]QIE84800.1 long-chain fatty acid--CoA ligase [Pseudomonas nitroreducens]
MPAIATGYVASEIARHGYQNLYDLLQRASREFPERHAFSCGDSHLTFAELDRQADAFARYLRHHAGLQPGDRLALMLPNSLQYPIATFGALKAGVVLVNTNPQYTASELRHQLADSGANAVLLLDRLLPLLRSVQAHSEVRHILLTSIDDMERPRLDSDEADCTRFQQALRLGAEAPPVPIEPGLDRLALLQYTGGTTGVSKGAMLSHRSLVANVVQTLELFLRPGLLDPATDVRIAPLPLYHIMAFSTNLLSSVGMGLHTVFIRDGRNLDEIIGAMRRYPFTLMSGINTLFVGLMNHPDFPAVDFSHLKWVTSGGAPLNREVGRRWEAATGAPVREGFGLTEASPVVSTGTLHSPYREGYVGQALVDTELRTVDEEGNDTGPDQPGELWLRGPQVMQGYWQRPEESAQVLTADGWLKTGDIAELDANGMLKIVDRKKDMILVSGFNVFPNEVEDAVMRHPGVRECVAIGVPDERKGESVKLFVSLKDESLAPAQIIAHCREHLTGYKVPSFVEVLDELPKTSVGKLLRRQLRDLELAKRTTA